jgi:flagellar basal body-associated protein FliL
VQGLLRKLALYGLPGALVLAAFGLGHLTIMETDVVIPRAADAALEQKAEAGTEGEGAGDAQGDEGGAPLTEAEQAALAAAAAAGNPNATLLPPVYKYYQFLEPFAGNIDGDGRLFSIEIALSTFQNPILADQFVVTLETMSAQLRPVVLGALVDVSRDSVLTIEGRAQLAETIRDALNAYLETKGERPAIAEVVISSFIVT